MEYVLSKEIFEVILISIRVIDFTEFAPTSGLSDLQLLFSLANWFFYNNRLLLYTFSINLIGRR